MGLRGPRPTPKVTLKIRGSKRANRGGPDPQFTPGAPQCPDHLGDMAKAEWARMVPELEGAGLITAADMAIFAAYCQAYGDWVEGCEQVENGKVLTGPNGGEYQNPWVSIRNTAEERMTKHASHFGFSPASRARVKAGPPPKEENPFEEFMNRGKSKKKPG